MKRIFTIALLAFFGLITHAQVTFKPGIRAGVNFSHFTKGDKYDNGYYDTNGNYISVTNRDTYKAKSDFYLGFYGALHLAKRYTLQPEIDYSRQGAIYDGNNPANIANGRKKDISYLSIEIINKFLFSDKLNVHFGPTADFIVEKSDNIDTDSDLDLAFVFGLEYNFTKNLGIEARVKKGVIPVIDYSHDNHTNVVFSFGGTYTFDLK